MRIKQLTIYTTILIVILSFMLFISFFNQYKTKDFTTISFTEVDNYDEIKSIINSQNLQYYVTQDDYYIPGSISSPLLFAKQIEKIDYTINYYNFVFDASNESLTSLNKILEEKMFIADNISKYNYHISKTFKVSIFILSSITIFALLILVFLIVYSFNKGLKEYQIKRILGYDLHEEISFDMKAYFPKYRIYIYLSSLSLILGVIDIQLVLLYICSIMIVFIFNWVLKNVLILMIKVNIYETDLLSILKNNYSYNIYFYISLLLYNLIRLIFIILLIILTIATPLLFGKLQQIKQWKKLDDYYYFPITCYSHVSYDDACGQEPDKTYNYFMTDGIFAQSDLSYFSYLLSDLDLGSNFVYQPESFYLIHPDMPKQWGEQNTILINENDVLQYQHLLTDKQIKNYDINLVVYNHSYKEYNYQTNKFVQNPIIFIIPNEEIYPDAIYQNFYFKASDYDQKMRDYYNQLGYKLPPSGPASTGGNVYLKYLDLSIGYLTIYLIICLCLSITIKILIPLMSIRLEIYFYINKRKQALMKLFGYNNYLKYTDIYVQEIILYILNNIIILILAQYIMFNIVISLLIITIFFIYTLYKINTQISYIEENKIIEVMKGMYD